MPSAASSSNASSVSNLSPADQAAFIAYHSLDNFLQLHAAQLTAMQLPQHLWSTVYDRIYNENDTEDNQVNPMTEMFSIAHDEDDDDDSTSSDHLGYRLLTNIAMKKHSTVFVIEHIWSTTSRDQGEQQLQQQPELIDRLWSMMDMDRRLQYQHRQQQRHPQQQEESVDVDESTISLVMSSASVDKETARQLLLDNKGDLIEAIHIAQAATENRRTEVNPSASASTSSSSRASLVWSALFAYDYVGQYHTTVASERSTPLTAADIKTTYYLDDEYGSSIRTATDNNNHNAILAPFVCVTLNGAAMSLLWLTEDIEADQEVKKIKRNTLRRAETQRET